MRYQIYEAKSVKYDAQQRVGIKDPWYLGQKDLGKSQLFNLPQLIWKQNDSSHFQPIVHSHQKGQVACRLLSNPIMSKMLCWVFETNSAEHFLFVLQNVLELGNQVIAHTELQLKSLKKILIAWRAWSSYETCFVISFLINHKTGSAVRRCLPD